MRVPRPLVELFYDKSDNVMSILSTIIALASIEVYHGNRETVLQHLKALKVVVLNLIRGMNEL